MDLREVRVPARLYWDHVPLANVARGLVANGVEPYASYSKLGLTN